MNIFQGMGAVKANQNNSYMPFGFAGVVEIESLTGKPNRKGVPTFIAELTMVTSNHPKAPAGSRQSWAINLSEPARALAEIKGFLLAVLGHVPGTFEKSLAAGDPSAQALNGQIDSLCARALQSDNPLAKRKVYLTTARKRTKAGGDFTVHVWLPEASAPAVLPQPTAADLAEGAPAASAPYAASPGVAGAPTWPGAPVFTAPPGAPPASPFGNDPFKR